MAKEKLPKPRYNTVAGHVVLRPDIIDKLAKEAVLDNEEKQKVYLKVKKYLENKR